jgi:hypothetical protein
MPVFPSGASLEDAYARLVRGADTPFVVGAIDSRRDPLTLTTHIARTADHRITTASQS